MYYIL